MSAPLKITKIERTCLACPAQWDAWADDGTYVYIRYRSGSFRVDVGGDPSDFKPGETIFRWQSEDTLDGYMDFDEMAELTKEVLDFNGLTFEERLAADGGEESMMIEVPKSKGERVALVPFDATSAVLILADRMEETGTFVSFTGGSARKYPVLAFYRPPEFCGIDEPTNDADYKTMQQELRSELLDSIRSTCVEFKVNTLYCAGVNEPGAKEYADELQRRGLELADIKTAKIPSSIALTVV